MPAIVVPEQGRVVAGRLPAGQAWSWPDQDQTQRLHLAVERAHADRLGADRGGLLVCDGTEMTPLVWHLAALRARPTYRGGDAAVVRLLTARLDPGRFALTLITAPDLPWAADGVRDDPDGRWPQFDLYRSLLSGCPVAVVGGAGDRRLRQARVELGRLPGLEALLALG